MSTDPSNSGVSTKRQCHLCKEEKDETIVCCHRVHLMFLANDARWVMFLVTVHFARIVLRSISKRTYQNW